MVHFKSQFKKSLGECHTPTIFSPGWCQYLVPIVYTNWVKSWKNPEQRTEPHASPPVLISSTYFLTISSSSLFPHAAARLLHLSTSRLFHSSPLPSPLLAFLPFPSPSSAASAVGSGRRQRVASGGSTLPSPLLPPFSVGGVSSGRRAVVVGGVREEAGIPHFICDVNLMCGFGQYASNKKQLKNTFSPGWY